MKDRTQVGETRTLRMGLGERDEIEASMVKDITAYIVEQGSREELTFHPSFRFE